MTKAPSLSTQAPAYLRNGFVIVPNYVAAWLHRHTDLNRIRPAVRGDDLVVDAVLIALRQAGFTTSADGSTGDVELLPTRTSMGQELTVQEAADMLGITPRAIRLACTQGRLTAHQKAGRWLIDPTDLHTYNRARRAA